MADQRLLSPLVAAYDARAALLEGAVAARESELAALAAQTRAVADENEGLQAQLREATDVLAARAVAAGRGGEDARAALLLQENDLLTAQTGELSEELTRLHRAQDDAARRRTTLEQEAAALVDAAAAAAAREAELGRQLAAAQAQAQRGGATDRAALELDMRALQGRHDAAAAECDALRRSRAADEAAAAAAAADADAARGEAAAARREAASLRATAAELRESLAAASARVREYQAKDVEVYGRIREAMEVAEQNKLAHDASAARETQLRAEVAALRERLAARGSGGGGGSDNGGTRRAQSELEATNRALADAQAEAVELRSALARADRDKRSLKVGARVGSEGSGTLRG